MASFKNPGFQERTALARQARQKALDQLRAKPPVDEAVLAKRNAARLIREQAEAEARAAKQAAREQAKANKAARAAEAADKVVATEAEQRAARDARYAARKSRKKSR
jgi:hypothetical protein